MALKNIQFNKEHEIGIYCVICMRYSLLQNRSYVMQNLPCEINCHQSWTANLCYTDSLWYYTIDSLCLRTLQSLHYCVLIMALKNCHQSWTCTCTYLFCFWLVFLLFLCPGLVRDIPLFITLSLLILLYMLITKKIKTWKHAFYLDLNNFWLLPMIMDYLEILLQNCSFCLQLFSKCPSKSTICTEL